ncbi:MAG: sigma-70 family RNA polymerase sigma factor [Clostridia bacterium]
MNLSENELLELFLTRNASSIEQTLEKYSKYLYSISYKILKNHQDVEECINDAVLKAWNTIPPKNPKSIKAYLGAIVRNSSLDCYRKQHSFKRNKDFEVILEEGSQCISKNIENADDLTHISTCISEYLSEKNSELQYIFVRRYYYGDLVKEIAEKRNISESKVKISLYRMREELRKRLEKEGVLL